MKSLIQSILPYARLKVLLVEDNRDDAELIEELLQVANNGFPSFDLTNALRVGEALNLLKQESFDLILLDLSLPDSQGFTTLATLQKNWGNLPIVVITASQDEDLGIQLVKAGAQDFLTKRNIDSQILIRTLRYAIERQHLQNALQQREAEYRSVVQKIQHEIVERQQAEEAWRISEERFRSLVANIPGAIYRCRCDSDWTMELISDEIEAISGYPASDFIQNRGLKFASIIHPEDTNRVEREVLEAVAARRSYNLEYRVVRQDGSLRWVYEKGRGVYSQEGEVLWLDGVIFDVSDRKQAEDELRLFRQAVESTSDAVGMADIQGSHFYQNQAFTQLYEYATAEEFNAAGGPKIAFADPNVGWEVITAIMNGESWLGEVEQISRTGKKFQVLLRANPIKDNSGKIVGLLGIMSDISDQKRAEAALRESQRRYQTLADASPVCIFHTDVEGNCLYVNQRWSEISGLNLELAAGVGWSSTLHPEDKERVFSEWYRATQANLPFKSEYRFERPDGKVSWVIGQAVAEIGDDGEIKGYVGTITDISEQQAALRERKAAEEALQQQILRERLVGTIFERIRSSLNLEEVLKTAVEEVRVFLQIDRTIIYRFTPQGRALIAVESFSETWQPILGANLAIPILQGGRLWGLLVAHHCSSLRHWQELEIESLNQISIQLAIAIQQSILFEQAQTEIAERKQAEAALQESEARERSKALQLENALNQLRNTQAQLVQTEKMAGLGQLVAGIAHEINNPVNFIYGNITPASEYAQNLLQLVDLYQKHYPTPNREIADEIESLDLDFLKEDFQKLIFSMKEGARRIKEIVLSLRNFSRLDEAEMKKVDLYSGIDSTLLILQHRLKKQPSRPAIEVFKAFANLPLVECYPGQLNQVLMNILTNAIDALEDRFTTDSSFTPTIRIATEVREREYSNPTSVVIRIADNGSGIPPHVQKRIFDPFFTTKPVGKGTGLGLSISYQIIVEKHRGTLQCNSRPGQGTEFTIELNIQQFGVQ